MKALLIDDSRAQRAYLKRMLAELGFAVTEAEDGERGLAQLRTSGPFDVALVDWNMPVMDGLAFLRHVRADAAHAAVPVVMVTSEVAMGRVEEALGAGASEYIMKPFSREVLADKLALLGLSVQ